MADTLVTCKVEGCGESKKSLAAHLRHKHNMSVAEYKSYCKERQLDDSIGYTVTQHGYTGNPHENKVKARKKADPLAKQFESLSDSERSFFTSRYEVLFRQADFDEALAPSLRQIVMNEIIAERWQAFINASTENLKVGSAHLGKDSPIVKAQDIIKNIIASNLALLDKMNLTREKKQAQKKVIETTPSRLITAYQEELERLTPEERRRLQEDNEDAVRRFHHNQATLLELIPESAAADDDEDEEL